MKKITLFLLLVVSTLAVAQSSREPFDGTKVAVSENYSAVVNAGTRNATVTSVVIPFHPRWAVEGNAFLLPGVDSKIITVGPQYARNLGNFLKKGKFFFDPANVDIFFHVGLGGKQQSLPAGFSASAFSAYAEAGIVYHKGPIDVFPVRFGFLRTSFGNNGSNAFLGPNLSQIISGVGAHF